MMYAVGVPDDCLVEGGGETAPVGTLLRSPWPVTVVGPLRVACGRRRVRAVRAESRGAVVEVVGWRGSAPARFVALPGTGVLTCRGPLAVRDLVPGDMLQPCGMRVGKLRVLRVGARFSALDMAADLYCVVDGIYAKIGVGQ